MSYDINQSVRLWANFEVDGIMTDPSAITLKIQDPSDNEDTYTYGAGTVDRHSVGVYYKDVVVDESGRWYYKFESSGGVTAAEENYFDVDASEF